MSIRAKRFIASSTRCWRSSGRPAWAAMPTARSGNLVLMRAASSSRSACLRLDRTTVAPCSASASALALPMPRLAPGRRATRPSRSNRELVGTADTISRPMAITGKAAEDILERIFQPTTKPSAMDQAEETLRHPKRLVYVAMSNKAFYWRARHPQFVVRPPLVPPRPLTLFLYYPLPTPSTHRSRTDLNHRPAPLVRLELQVEPGQTPDQDLDHAATLPARPIRGLQLVEAQKDLAAELVHDQVAIALYERHRPLHVAHDAPLCRQHAGESRH